MKMKKIPNSNAFEIHETPGLKRYSFLVVETRTVACDYIVEAESLSEAEEKARKGDTVDESTLDERGVINREVEELFTVEDLNR